MLYEKYSLLTKLIKCALNIALKLTFSLFLVFLCVLAAFQASQALFNTFFWATVFHQMIACVAWRFCRAGPARAAKPRAAMLRRLPRWHLAKGKLQSERAVSGEKQIYCGGNLEILPGIGKPGKFSGKLKIIGDIEQRFILTLSLS